MNLPPAIDTERLHLRPPTLGDAGLIFSSYAQDPDVSRYVTWTPHRSVDETKSFLSSCIELSAQQIEPAWVITERGSDDPIGMISTKPQGHMAEVGYVLAKAKWGNGLITEAGHAVVQALLANAAIFRVWAVCDIDNPASAKVLLKLGMKFEGILKRWALHPNMSPDPRDCMLFAKVRE